ncbi:MAG: cytochrome c-type biogenesis protein [Longimicrobiales bacterium]
MRLTLASWLILGFGLAASPPLDAQDVRPLPDPVAREAISKIRSPFCPGLMLEVCPTTTAAALRDSIQTMASTGMSADSVVELVIARHGEEYRAFPKRSGTGLLAWVMPPIALLLGLGLVVLALKKMKEPVGLTAQGPLSETERSRLDDALAELEEDGL